MNSLVLLCLLVLAGWCLVLSYKLFRLNHSYSKTLQKSGKTTLDEALHALLANDARFDHVLEELQNESASLVKGLQSAVTRVGLLKFDPFGRTAGDQSFIVALLDSSETGFLLTCMYTREGMRLFPKIVKQGKGVSSELSAEEKKAIDSAKIL